MKSRRRFGALKRRLHRLEGERDDELVTELLLDDGTTVILRGRDADPARVVRGVLDPNPDPETAARIDLIRRSVSIKEAGGGLIIELFASIMPNPLEDSPTEGKNS